MGDIRGASRPSFFCGFSSKDAESAQLTGNNYMWGNGS